MNITIELKQVNTTLHTDVSASGGIGGFIEHIVGKLILTTVDIIVNGNLKLLIDKCNEIPDSHENKSFLDKAAKVLSAIISDQELSTEEMEAITAEFNSEAMADILLSEGDGHGIN